MKTIAQLQRHTGKGHHIGINRDIAGTYRLYGFVLACSSELVLIHLVEDFHLDGYQILRLCDVETIRHSASDGTMERILKAEGVLDRVGLEHVLNLASWRSVFQGLKALGENVIVEAEEPDLDEFVVGRIMRVNQKAVSMQHFDGTGMWEDETISCPYDHITSARFRCEYINVFSKHLRKRKTDNKCSHQSGSARRCC